MYQNGVSSVLCIQCQTLQRTRSFVEKGDKSEFVNLNACFAYVTKWLARIVDRG